MHLRLAAAIIIGVVAGSTVLAIVGADSTDDSMHPDAVTSPRPRASKPTAADTFELRHLHLRPLGEIGGHRSRSHARTSCSSTDICSDTIFKDSFEPPCVPLPDGCGAVEICGNGLDDDCNGQVDDGCACQPGATQSCFAGTPGQRNAGVCTDGLQTCVGTEFGTWGPCIGGVGPSAEVCDGLDNDCNGCVEE